MKVPATTRIRSSRVGNIDTDRLRRRAVHLRRTLPSWAKACDGRKELRDRAREMLAVEAELERRGVDPHR